MSKIELKKKYVSENFGKPNEDGTYRIRTDSQNYELLVDDVPVIYINVEYERFSSTEPYYASANISYGNYFYFTKEKYVNKGYATIALKQVTELIEQDDNVVKISLDINKDNYASLRVAEKAGYKYIRNNEYSIFNQNAIPMIERGLEYLKDKDNTVYEMQMYSWLDSYKRYLEQIKEKTNRGVSL